MSNYTPLVHETAEFDGDTVTYDLRRMKKEDMVAIKPLMPEPDEDGRVVMNMSDNMKLLDAVIEMLPRYVSNFKGLKTKDGTEITFEDMLGETYFYSLQTEIASKLQEHSWPKAGDEKNSAAQSSEAFPG